MNLLNKIRYCSIPEEPDAVGYIDMASYNGKPMRRLVSRKLDWTLSHGTEGIAHVLDIAARASGFDSMGYAARDKRIWSAGGRGGLRKWATLADIAHSEVDAVYKDPSVSDGAVLDVARLACMAEVPYLARLSRYHVVKLQAASIGKE